MKTNSGYKVNSELGTNVFTYFNALDNSTLELDVNRAIFNGDSIPFRRNDSLISALHVGYLATQVNMYDDTTIPVQSVVSHMIKNSVLRHTAISTTGDLYPDFCHDLRNGTMMSIQVIMHNVLSGQTFTLVRYLDSGTLQELASNCLYAMLYRQVHMLSGANARQIVMGHAYTTSGMKLINFDTGSYISQAAPQQCIRVQSTSSGINAQVSVYHLSPYPVYMS